MPVPHNGVDTRRAYATPVAVIRTRGLNCDPDTANGFYPERGDKAKDARAACALCRARAACASFAVRTEQAHGVWGGLGPNDRYRLIRRFGNDPDRAAAYIEQALTDNPARAAVAMEGDAA